MPEQITETHYRTIEDVIEKTVVDYKLVKEDCGCYEQQAYVDDCGCTKYRKVWVPRYVTKKVPYERVVKQVVTREVPYEVTRTVYREVVKKIPVQRKKMVPYIVYKRIPYQVAKHTCETPGYGHGGPGYGHPEGGRGEGGYGDFRPVGYGG